MRSLVATESALQQQIMQKCAIHHSASSSIQQGPISDGLSFRTSLVIPLPIAKILRIIIYLLSRRYIAVIRNQRIFGRNRPTDARDRLVRGLPYIAPPCEWKWEWILWKCEWMGRGNGLAVEPTSRNPEGRGSIPRLGSRRSSLISIEHAELLRSTASAPSLVLCCACLVTTASHVHCGLSQLSPLPSLQFRYNYK